MFWRSMFEVSRIKPSVVHNVRSETFVRLFYMKGIVMRFFGLCWVACSIRSSVFVIHACISCVLGFTPVS